jgi:hypothetical protein
LTVLPIAGEYELTTPSAAFSGIAVGDHVFFHGGKFEVTDVASAVKVTAVAIREPQNKLHVSSSIPPIEGGKWGWAKLISGDVGLWHLDGEVVSMNIDGDCYLNVPVVRGKAALPVPGTIISAGLQYTCDAQTLPPSFPEFVKEGKVHSIVSAAVRLQNTRGLSSGNSSEDLIELKDRTNVDWGTEMPLRSDFADILMAANYDELGSIYFQQTYPLPAKILSFVLTVDVGDE